MHTDRFKGLHTNQRLLLEELAGRGVEIDILVRELELVEARFGSHIEFIVDRDSSALPYSGSIICADKYLTRKILIRAGLPVPQGEQFFPDQFEQAISFGEATGFPLVVKPSTGSHGLGCVTDLESVPELRAAIDGITEQFGKNASFLVEKQRPGMEFRVFVTRNGDYAVLHRDPAHVEGDGQHTIAELCEMESFRRMNPRNSCLCPIVIDDTVKVSLKKAGLTLDSVPAAGSTVYLRRNSNVALGGFCEDYTGLAHPSVVELACNALRCIHGLPYAGVDILTTDITRDQSTVDCCILEINSNPGLHMHMRPGRGSSRNVAAWLADIIFPETRRQPVATEGERL